MGRKDAEGSWADARIRAHLRQMMDDAGIDMAELQRRIGADSGNFSRQMNGTRGFGSGLILRICIRMKITPTRLLGENPPDRFFQGGSIPPELAKLR